MQEFTLEQIGMQVTALQNFFDQVTLIDPLAQAEVDPATLQATGHADAVPVLNADGRGWQPILGEDTGFVFYQNIQVEHRPFVLAATYFLTADLPPMTARQTLCCACWASTARRCAAIM